MTVQLSNTTWATGNWARTPTDLLSKVFQVAGEWKSCLKGVEKPWLCWCVHPDWCVIQQELVLECGWTPIVCADSTNRNVQLVDGSLYLDFTKSLDPPGNMWMHFPMELAHLFIPKKLAFWHSDLLPPVNVLQAIAKQFESIVDGQVIAVRNDLSWRQKLHQWLRFQSKTSDTPESRWFELIGCTTPSASESQFSHGCGWWRHISKHPNADARWRDKPVFYDHGVGIKYWERFCGGIVLDVCQNVDEFHHDTRTLVKKHKLDKADALANYDLETLRRTLQLK